MTHTTPSTAEVEEALKRGSPELGAIVLERLRANLAEVRALVDEQRSCDPRRLAFVAYRLRKLAKNLEWEADFFKVEIAKALEVEQRAT